MATMQSFLDKCSQRRGQQNQSSGDFLSNEDFRPYRTLDGSCARKFFEDNGYEVTHHGDLENNGVAITKCGWVLSTNGYLGYNAGYAKYVATKLEAKVEA